MRHYTRNQLARRLDMMEAWRDTIPRQPASTDCPPASVRVRGIDHDHDHDYEW